MDNTNLQLQVDQLKKDLQALVDETYKNNFSAHQDFNKTSNFTTRLIVPHYNVLPISGNVGEVLEMGGKLYICSSINKFTLVGTQT